MQVHQLVGAAGPYDAITNQVLQIRNLLTGWGYRGQDFAFHRDSRIAGRFTDVKQLNLAPDDILFVQFSAYTPGLEELLQNHPRSLVLCQNITPPSWFWAYDAATAAHCFLGRAQAAKVMSLAGLRAAASQYTADEFDATDVLPIFFDPDHYGNPPTEKAEPAADGGEILFVGRLCPHKRHDQLIRMAALLSSLRPNCSLRIVGEPVNESYGRSIGELGQQLLGDRFIWERGIDQEALADRYRQADIFVCFSEHEGFCIPILESFHFRLPVVAVHSGGVSEVAGEGGLIADSYDLREVTNLVDLTLSSPKLRSQLQTAGLARLDAYSAEKTSEKIHGCLKKLSA